MSIFSVVQQNRTAIRPERENNQWMGHRKQLCLRCQKDKKQKEEASLGSARLENLSAQTALRQSNSRRRTHETHQFKLE